VFAIPSRALRTLLIGLTLGVLISFISVWAFAQSTLLSPTDTCSGAANLNECYQLYIADRLFERHAVDVGAATFIDGAGPAVLVLAAGATVVLLVRGARFR